MKLKSISSIGKKLGLTSKDLIPYGYDKAKICTLFSPSQSKAKLILVTAITPTKAGEGKTTTSIAIADALSALGKKAVVVLREPSLGPVFGMKGGATGGGKVTVEPSEDINLHFTGDMHALTSSINLIAAVLDNSIFQGNLLNINPDKVVYKRAMDMNDRALREITVAQGPTSSKTGKPLNGIPRKDGFVITVAHEMMAILCLAKDRKDFKERLGRMIVAYTFDDKPITVKDFKVTNAVMKLMKYAFMPNLVQTSSNTPAIIHGGPFANIAHGCNSIIATRTGMALADYVVTEAGFGSDLGAEKFLDIKCQEAKLKPDLVVMVATIRALKLHGGEKYEELDKENIQALLKGLPNLKRHVENMKKFGMDVVININRFATDSNKEIQTLENWCEDNDYPYEMDDAFARGPKGATKMAQLVLERIESNLSDYHPIVTKEMTAEDKIKIISKDIYGAKDVIFSPQAKEDLKNIHLHGQDDYYVCMAKTPLSFSDDPTVLGAPTDFDIHVKNIEIAAGAKFLIPITGTILRMPGLPKVPAACKMEEEKDE